MRSSEKASGKQEIPSPEGRPSITPISSVQLQQVFIRLSSILNSGTIAESLDWINRIEIGLKNCSIDQVDMHSKVVYALTVIASISREISHTPEEKNRTNKIWDLVKIAMQRFNVDFGFVFSRDAFQKFNSDLRVNLATVDDDRGHPLGNYIFNSNREDLIILMRQKDPRYLYLDVRREDFKLEQERIILEAVEKGDIKTIATLVKQGTNINTVIQKGAHRGVSLLYGLTCLMRKSNAIDRDTIQLILDCIREMIYRYPREEYPEPLNVNLGPLSENHGERGETPLLLWINTSDYEEWPEIKEFFETVIINKNKFHANLNCRRINPARGSNETIFENLISEHAGRLEGNLSLIQYVMKNYSQSEANIDNPETNHYKKGCTGISSLAVHAIHWQQRGNLARSNELWGLVKFAITTFNIRFNCRMFSDSNMTLSEFIREISRRADLISLIDAKLLKKEKERKHRVVNVLRPTSASDNKKQSLTESKKNPAPEKQEAKKNKTKQKKETHKAVEVEREQQIKEFEKTISKKIEKLNEEVRSLQEKIKAAEEARKPVNEAFRRLYKAEEINQWKETLEEKLKTAKERKEKSHDEYVNLYAAIENYGAVLSKLEHHFSQIKKNKKSSEKFHRGEKQRLTPQEKLKLEKKKRKEELEKEKKEKEEREKKRNEEKEKTRQVREEKEKQDQKNSELIEKSRAEKEREKEIRKLRDEKIKAAEEKARAEIEREREVRRLEEEKAKKEKEDRVKTLFHMATPHIKSFIIGGIELQGLEALEKKSYGDFTELRMLQLSSFYHLLRYYVITRQIEGHNEDQIAMRNAIAHISMEFDLRLKTLHKAVDEIKSTLLSELKIVPGISKETIKSFVDLITGPSKIESSVTSITQTELYQEFKRINDNITCDLKKSDLSKSEKSISSEEDTVYKDWVLTRMIPSINRFMAYYSSIKNKFKEFRKELDENHQCREALNAIRMLLEWCGEFYNDERAGRFKKNPRIKPEEIRFLEETRRARISVGHFIREIPEEQIKQLADMAKNLSKIPALFEDLHFSFSLRARQAVRLSANAAAFTPAIGGAAKAALMPTSAPMVQKRFS